MKRNELNQMLGMFATYGIPIVYYSFPDKSAPELPYAVYYFPSSRAEAADNIRHAGVATINVELYTREKNFLLEHTVEQIFERFDLVPDKTETFLPSENMYQVLYQMEDIEEWVESDSD